MRDIDPALAPSVLMFCPHFRPTVGGAERQVEKLAAELARSGCNVRVLTPRREPDSPDVEHENNVTIERFPLDDLSQRLRVPGVGLLNIPYILWQVVRAVRPRLVGAQILHCHIASLETAGAALAGHTRGVPVICKAAMADDRSDLGEIAKGAFSGRIVAHLVRMVIRNWVATTTAVQDALVRAGVKPERIVRIPNGVDLPIAAGGSIGTPGADPSSTSTSTSTGAGAAASRSRVDVAEGSSDPARVNGRSIRRFLYIGRLSSNIQRDVPTLIDAFTDLAASEPTLELAIVGGGDLFEATRQHVARSSARDRIHLPGFDAPERWLAWADCFVLPSRREGLSNALLEAMAAGLPCIANDIGPNREVLEDGLAGVLVPIEDRAALAMAMRDFVRDADCAAGFAARASQRVARLYAITGVAHRYIDFYRSLVVR